MITSILHLEHLSQQAGLEAAGGLMISYPLIKACLCLIYQSGSLSKMREIEELILTDSFWLRGPLWIPQSHPSIRWCTAQDCLDQIEGGDWLFMDLKYMNVHVFFGGGCLYVCLIAIDKNLFIHCIVMIKRPLCCFYHHLKMEVFTIITEVA